MKIMIVFCFIASLFFLPVRGIGAEEVFVGDDLLTLPIEDLKLVSAAFSSVCAEENVAHFSPELVLPYFYTFVRQCEQLVLEEGFFPHDLPVHIFDHQFDAVVNRSDSGSALYSHLAVRLLQVAWRDRIALCMKHLLRHGMLHSVVVDENLGPVFSHSEDVYVLSAMLSALAGEPYEVLSERLGIRAESLFSPEVGSFVKDFTKKVSDEKVDRTQQVEVEDGEQHVFLFVVYIFPILLFVNVFAVILMIVVLWRRSCRQRLRNAF